MRIVLVGCSKQKLAYSAPARDLYTGPLFRAARGYAEQYGDAWFILSARHGLLPPETPVFPYDQSLTTMTPAERAAWGAQIQQQLFRAIFSLRLQGQSLENPHWVILAGRRYRTPLRGFLAGTVETPLAGMGIGQQIAWLKRQVPADKVACGRCRHDEAPTER